MLEEICDDQDRRFLLRPAGGGPPLLVQRGPAPRFARDLPPGAFRDRLAPLLEPRALLPIAVTEISAEPLRLRDSAGRVIARLSLESGRVGPPGSAPTIDLPPVLVVHGGRRAAAITPFLAGMADVEPAGTDMLDLILAPLGRRPRDYSGKVHVDLDPAMKAQDALRAILRHLLETMERNLPGLQEGDDPEFLHDFRVAVRRTRSALGQFQGILPPSTLQRFAPQFVHLQEITGPARDLDVYCLELPALGALLPARYRRSLAPLRRHLEHRRRMAYLELSPALAAPRFLRFLSRWRTFLERPPRRARGAPQALEPIGGLASGRIARLFRRAVREGKAITGASPAADLHELRKTCKKLRYLLEFFQGIFDRDEVAHFVESLKALQDNLGRHQDLQVQSAALSVYARELAQERRTRPSAFLAMGMLIERLREQQLAARREFAQRFEPFARGRNRKRLRELLEHHPPERGKSQPREITPDGERDRA